MADLLSSTEKAAISSALGHVADTFKRPVRVFSKTVSTFSNTSSNHNGLFGQNKTTNPQEQSVTSSIIHARVKFMDKSEIGKISGINTSTNISLPEGSIRLKISDEDYTLVKKSVKIEYGGLNYVLHSDAGKIGPFDINYYTLYFSRTDT
jgi:hypothetical protein